MRTDRLRIGLLTIAGSGLALGANATIWQVGPGHTYTLPSQVSALVNHGDTVDIAAGTYPNDVASWTANDLLLRGMGGRAHLESNGNAWGGKAIWVLQGDRTRVEWIEFSECAVPDANGAGIRLEGKGLTVRHAYFHHNENGILCGALEATTVRIEHSEFAHNGHGDGYSHNLYIGAVDSLIFRFNYSHHAHIGHELKSRARVNVIHYNRFSNEADGDASREIDLPNGGQAYLIGNVVQQGPQGQNSNLIGFGLEGLSSPAPHALYAVHNTLVNERANGTFFHTPAGVHLKAWNNILAGGGQFMSAWPNSVDTLANLRRTDIATVGFLDPSNYNYHLDGGSAAQGLGMPAGTANNGTPLLALYEYVHPCGMVERCQHATLDAGAFESCTTGIVESVGAGIRVFPVPTTDDLWVDMGASRGRFTLVDATGRIQLQGMLNSGQQTLSMTHLPVRMYFLCVEQANGPQVWRVQKQ